MEEDPDELPPMVKGFAQDTDVHFFPSLRYFFTVCGGGLLDLGLVVLRAFDLQKVYFLERTIPTGPRQWQMVSRARVSR